MNRPTLRLLVVEDDEVFGSAVQRHLLRAGHQVRWVRSCQELDAAWEGSDFQAVLLDLGLPDGSGVTALQEIRRRSERLPVLVMTARGAVADRVALLDIGADDYLVKPFDLDELTARLRSVMRRVRTAGSAEIELRHGALKIVPQRRVVTWFGEPVQLTNKEYVLLEYLLQRKNQVLTRAQLEGRLFGDLDDVDSNALEVYVHFLRRKFGRGLITTVRGVGYQLGSGSGFER